MGGVCISLIGMKCFKALKSVKTIFRYLVFEIWSISLKNVPQYHHRLLKLDEKINFAPILLVTSSKYVSEDSMKIQKKKSSEDSEEKKIHQKWMIKKNQIYHICKIKNCKIVFS